MSAENHIRTALVMGATILGGVTGYGYAVQNVEEGYTHVPETQTVISKDVDPKLAGLAGGTLLGLIAGLTAEYATDKLKR